MSKNQKIIAGVVVALLIALIGWTVKTLPTLPDTVAPPDKRVMTYDGNTISSEKNGKLIWEATAEKIEVDIDTQNASMTNMKAKFYAEDGRVVELDAPKAFYDAKSKDLQVDGGIKGTGTDGLKLNCEKVQWQAKDNCLVLLGNVLLERTTDHVKATGDKIESTDGFTKFKISGKAHLEKGNG